MDSELLSIWEESERTWWIELLLRKCVESCSSDLPPARLREKKEAFDAVMGVLGVFVLVRRGGVLFPSETEGSCKAATLAAVGVLNGRRLRGGSRKGRKFFFFTGVVFCCSTSDIDPAGPYFRD